MDANQTTTLRLIAKSGRNVGTRLSTELGITRQAASGRLSRLVKAGLIEASGTSRARVYRLKPLQNVSASYHLPTFTEDVVWRELCAPVVADLPENVRDIWHYGITEMVNNAIDHSGGKVVTIGMSKTGLYTTAWVSDDGQGIFLKIQRALNLYDPRESILELAKGKFTTDPANRNDNGILATARSAAVRPGGARAAVLHGIAAARGRSHPRGLDYHDLTRPFEALRRELAERPPHILVAPATVPGALADASLREGCRAIALTHRR